MSRTAGCPRALCNGNRTAAGPMSQSLFARPIDARPFDHRLDAFIARHWAAAPALLRQALPGPICTPADMLAMLCCMSASLCAGKPIDTRFFVDGLQVPPDHPLERVFRGAAVGPHTGGLYRGRNGPAGRSRLLPGDRQCGVAASGGMATHAGPGWPGAAPCRLSHRPHRVQRLRRHRTLHTVRHPYRQYAYAHRRDRRPEQDHADLAPGGAHVATPAPGQQRSRADRSAGGGAPRAGA